MDDISILEYYRRFINPKTRDDRARDVPRGHNIHIYYDTSLYNAKLNIRFECTKNNSI